MKNIFTALFLFVSAIAFSQTKEEEEHWAHWNQSYPLVNIVKILDNEKHYADSVEKHPEIAPTYVRKGAYRFKAQFTGQTRAIDSGVVRSVKWAAKMTLPHVIDFDNLLFKEGLFKVGEQTLWMPIQKAIFNDFVNEVKTNGEVTLYCLFLNEHTMKNKLYNTFIISEFIAH